MPASNYPLGLGSCPRPRPRLRAMNGARIRARRVSCPRVRGYLAPVAIFSRRLCGHQAPRAFPAPLRVRRAAPRCAKCQAPRTPAVAGRHGIPLHGAAASTSDVTLWWRGKTEVRWLLW